MIFKVKKIISALFLVCIISGANPDNSSGTKVGETIMELYFVTPFSIETYSPVTAENIEEQGYAIWFMAEHKFASELQSMLTAHPTKSRISPKHIRLKAVFTKTGSIFLVDQNGRVLRQDTMTTFMLSASELEQLEHQLQYFRGVVDVKAIKNNGWHK